MSVISKSHVALVGLGALIGAAGAQAVRTGLVRGLAVKGVVAGMRIKDEYEGIVEQAKAEVDDIVAEAAYLRCASAVADDQADEAQVADDQAADAQ